MKLHPGLGWRIFRTCILTSDYIDDFTHRQLYLNSLVHDWNIFGSSSKVFSNFSGYIRQNPCHHQYVYIIKRTLQVSSKILILCSCRSKNNKLFLPLEKKKFISSCHRVISSIYHMNGILHFDWLATQAGSGQDVAILPALDYLPHPARKITPKAI